MSGLQAQIHGQLVSLDRETWLRLFPSLPDTYAQLRLLDEIGMDGFSFGSLSVSYEGRPILLVPLFWTTLKLETLAGGSLRRCLGQISRLPVLGRMLRMRVMGIGFVEGEWGEIGYDRECSPALVTEAISKAQALFACEAVRRKQQLQLCLNFKPEFVTMLRSQWAGGFSQLETYPCGYLPLPYPGVEDYIADLSKNARKDIRKKLRECGPFRVERRRFVEDSREAVYELYRSTVDGAELSLGIQPPAFFDRLPAVEPGAHFVLYWLNDTLIAFNLLIRHGDRLIDKYFCMSPRIGRDNHLYFASWIENVRYCIEQRIGTYHAGPGAQSTKARLGAKFVRSITLFRHRNPMIQAILVRLRSFLAYQPIESAPAAMPSRRAAFETAGIP
ncbi:MAG: hypothetical protein JWM57_226 [Phycisphaerales bacterium]|nr:hypothetical protein [Phycisphaerales bacterium]